MNTEVKHAADVAALTGAWGAWLSLLPEVAALFALVWTIIRIFEWVEKRFIQKKKGSSNE